MGEQLVDGVVRAVDDVEDSRGQAGLLEQLGDSHRREWCELRRLEDEGIPRYDGNRNHPQRHHVGEVEGRDSGDDPDRKTRQFLVDALGDLVEILAHHQGRRAAGKVDYFDGTLDLAAGLVERLAVFPGHDLGQLVDVLVEERFEAEHHLRPLRNWGLAPGREGLLRRGDRLVDLLAGRVREARDRLSGRGVRNRVRFFRPRIAEFAADEALDVLGGDQDLAPTGLGSLAGTSWNGERRRNWPAPLTPWNFPSRTRTLPRCITTCGRPFTIMPS